MYTKIIKYEILDAKWYNFFKHEHNSSIISVYAVVQYRKLPNRGNHQRLRDTYQTNHGYMIYCGINKDIVLLLIVTTK